ncbi:hypothetical protein FRC20_008015 [Serendipita sp. 405]|nr:hypothetical protein FRC20_008015 [Serendipita sp. 405]
MLVLQNEDTGPEDLSKYRKRAFEYVEEEKIVLDALVVLYRKRLEIVQNHSKALEELRSTTMNILDTSSSLYDVLVRPVMDCLRKDIESYTQYTRDIEQDLTRITFTSGPRLEASIIEQDLDAVKRLYREYSASRIAVLELSPPPSMKRLPDEDIEHRRIAAKLHPKQKVARTHFETSYPLLNDHMKYMEQVRRLVCGTILLVGVNYRPRSHAMQTPKRCLLTDSRRQMQSQFHMRNWNWSKAVESIDMLSSSTQRLETWKKTAPSSWVEISILDLRKTSLENC